jgi:DNA-binding response OmpR family regulator
MRILLADDERQLADALTRYLEQAGHEVCTVITGGLDVLPAYDRFRPDVVLMDVMMPRFNGITISHALLSRNPSLKLVLCSGALSKDHPFIAASGATCFLPKPFSFASAREVLESYAPTAEASVAEAAVA